MLPVPVTRNIPRDRRSFGQSVEWVASWQAFSAAQRKGAWRHGQFAITRCWLTGFVAACVGYAKGVAMIVRSNR